GIAAVMIPAGVNGVGAQVFVTRPAELADPAGMPKPRNPNPFTKGKALGFRYLGNDPPNDFMPWCHVFTVNWQVPLRDVEVGMTNPTGQDLNQHFSTARRRD